jgi:single-stranded-DNA-specific exonuclease
MAAGLTIKKEDIQAFSTHIKEASQDFFRSERPIPPLLIDCEISLDQITHKLIDEMESLRPFGQGNKEPLFMARQVFVVSSSLVAGAHRRMTLSQNKSQSEAGKPIAAIQFNIDPAKPAPEQFQQIAFKIRWNRWNNKKIAQILIEET